MHSINGGSKLRTRIVIRRPELKTLEWDILNPERMINLEIKKNKQYLISRLRKRMD